MTTFQKHKFGQPKYGSGGVQHNKNISEKNFRKGKAGSWKEEMSPEVQRLFWRLHGDTMRQMGYTNEAIDYSMEALRLVEKSKDTSAMGNIYNVIAGLNRSLGNYEKSLIYFDKALATLPAEMDPINHGIGLVNKAELLYINLYDTIQAKKLLMQAESLIDTTTITSGVIRLSKSVSTAFGNLYLAEGNWQKALYYSNKTLALSEMMQSQLDKSRALTGISQALMLKGDLKGSKTKAIEAIEIAVDNNMLIEESAARSSLYLIYKKMGQDVLALENYERHIEIETQIK